MTPTIVGMSVVILGLTAWCVWLTVTLYDVRDTAADAIDAQTTLYMKLYSRLQALESPAYPKYLGTLTGSQIDADGCDGMDTPPIDVNAMYGKGIVGWRGDAVSKYPQMADPEEHPFFQVTPEQSQDFDDDVSHRMSELHKAVKRTAE